jgi:hypothetical protein
MTREQLFAMSQCPAQGSVTNTEMEMYCTRCNTVLKKVRAGGMVWTDLKGDCDCSWECCPHPGSIHPSHLAYRPGVYYKRGDIVTVNSFDVYVERATIILIEDERIRYRGDDGIVGICFAHSLTYPR